MPESGDPSPRIEELLETSRRLRAEADRLEKVARELRRQISGSERKKEPKK
jgi:hypothetical protein